MQRVRRSSRQDAIADDGCKRFSAELCQPRRRPILAQTKTENSRTIRPESRFPPLLLHELPNLVEFRTINFLVFDQVHQERLRRTVENALHEFVNHIADNLTLRLGRTVEVGTIARGFGQPTFLLEYPHHRHYSRISNFPALEEFLINV